MDQETRIETRMILRSERCSEAESGMRREGVKGWAVFRAFGPRTSEAPSQGWGRGTGQLGSENFSEGF